MECELITTINKKRKAGQKTLSKAEFWARMERMQYAIVHDATFRYVPNYTTLIDRLLVYSFSMRIYAIDKDGVKFNKFVLLNDHSKYVMSISSLSEQETLNNAFEKIDTKLISYVALRLNSTLKKSSTKKAVIKL
jgi:hypothetical protein